jgi:hypothetical protein
MLRDATSLNVHLASGTVDAEETSLFPTVSSSEAQTEWAENLADQRAMPCSKTWLVKRLNRMTI